MNLRSGTLTEFKKHQPKKKSANIQIVRDDMAESREMHKLFAELRESLNKEFQGLKKDLKDFRQETERDIKTIMQQTVSNWWTCGANGLFGN